MNENRIQVQRKLTALVGADCTELEQAIYDNVGDNVVQVWSPHFKAMYLKKLQTIMYNLRANPALRLHTPLKAIARMTHQEMNPDLWTAYMKRKTDRDKFRTSQTLQASTDMYTCGNCKKSECVYTEVQTRSADESTTIFVRCVNCNNHWRC
jgi:transcription elongation factor S-II